MPSPALARSMAVGLSRLKCLEEAGMKTGPAFRQVIDLFGTSGPPSWTTTLVRNVDDLRAIITR